MLGRTSRATFAADETVTARTSFAAEELGPGIVVRRGEVRRGDDPVVRAHPENFVAGHRPEAELPDPRQVARDEAQPEPAGGRVVVRVRPEQKVLHGDRTYYEGDQFELDAALAEPIGGCVEIVKRRPPSKATRAA